MVKMAVFVTFCNQPKLISRKILVAEKSLNFHAVWVPKTGSSLGDEDDPADPCWLLDVILHDTEGSSIGIGFEELAAGDFP